MNKNSKKRIGIIFSFLMLLSSIFVYSLFFKEKIPVYPVSILNQGGFEDYSTLIGTTFDLKLQKIYLDSDKTVSETYVEKGQKVDKGTALFKYDTANIEIDMKKNELKIQQLQNKIKNNNNVNLEELQLELKKENVKFDENKNKYNQSIYYSDYDGIVENIASIKDTGKPFMEIYGGKGMNVSIEVPESQLEDVHENDDVFFTTYDFSKSYQGKIVSKDVYPSKIESNISYYRVIAWIQDSENLSVATELNVSFPTEDEPAIWLENAYIRQEQGKKYVLKADKKGKLKKTFVKTGQSRYGMSTEIVEGLKESDYIAFPHGKHVKEGAKVKKEGDEK